MNSKQENSMKNSLRAAALGFSLFVASVSAWAQNAIGIGFDAHAGGLVTGPL